MKVDSPTNRPTQANQPANTPSFPQPLAAEWLVGSAWSVALVAPVATASQLRRPWPLRGRRWQREWPTTGSAASGWSAHLAWEKWWSLKMGHFSPKLIEHILNNISIHPASRGVAAHTAGLFRSVRGAKGGFPPWGLFRLRSFNKKSFQNMVCDSVFPMFPVKQTVIYTFFAIKAVNPSKTLLLTVFL